MKEFESWREKDAYIRDIDSMSPSDIIEALKDVGYKGDNKLESIYKCLPVGACVEKQTENEFVSKGISKNKALNEHMGLFISTKPVIALAKMLLRLSLLGSVNYDKIYGVDRSEEVAEVETPKKETKNES